VNPDTRRFYMWTFREIPPNAWFRDYQAFVSHQPKGFGNRATATAP